MNQSRVDRIAKVFADRKRSRRQAVDQGGAGLAVEGVAVSVLPAAAAPEATPEATPDPTGAVGDRGPTMLFVQTYQAGTIAPVEGSAGRYTLTLEAGSGQTVYFSDRPDRIVGANPTSAFLEGLGFPDDNPPNAALVVETAPGEIDVAVVELFAPAYDPVGQGVTYEIEVLANWQSSLEMGFSEAPTDLAALAPNFGSAQLFIDDCPDADMTCHSDFVVRNPETARYYGTIGNAEHDGYCYSWGAVACLPCRPWFGSKLDAYRYWNEQCNQRFPDCYGHCAALNVCSSGLVCH